MLDSGNLDKEILVGFDLFFDDFKQRVSTEF